MRDKFDAIIQKLENIPVTGVHAILMGDALKALFILREEVTEDVHEESDDPEEAEEGEH